MYVSKTSNMSFKLGDQIKCIQTSSHCNITLDKEYTVIGFGGGSI